MALASFPFLCLVAVLRQGLCASLAGPELTDILCLPCGVKDLQRPACLPATLAFLGIPVPSVLVLLLQQLPNTWHLAAQ